MGWKYKLCHPFTGALDKSKSDFFGDVPHTIRKNR